MDKLSHVLSRVAEEYEKYDWETLDRAGLNKKGDYCFIFSYPPVRTLQPISEDALLVPSEYGSLKEPASLYIHIPYCTGICSYCYFAKVIDRKSAPVPREAYPGTLHCELDWIRKHIKENPTITSIHFGGGTPSILNKQELSQIMRFLSELDLTPGIEITLECSPETIEREPDKLKTLQELGINRLNLGVESLDDKVLRYMGRRHNSDSTLRVLDLMFGAGYDNINVDLIYDLPGQTLESWIDTLCTLEERGVHSISTYRLRKHPMKKISHMENQFYPAYETGLKMQLAHGIVMEEMGFVRSSSHKYARTKEKLQQQVENKRGVEQNQLISLGCGAYGFINATFYWNTKSLTDYGQAVHSGRMPIWIGQVLSKDEMMRKTMIMGMHTNSGVSVSGFKLRYSEDPVNYFSDVIEHLSRLGVLEIANDHIGPTHMGRFFSDEISVAFYSENVRTVLEQVGMKYGMFFEHDRYA